MTDSCPNCDTGLGRLAQYRCPGCGIDLTGDEKETSGRDQR